MYYFVYKPYICETAIINDHLFSVCVLQLLRWEQLHKVSHVHLIFVKPFRLPYDYIS